MIGEIDDAMKALVREAPGIGKDIEVVLEAPTKEWAARRNAPTVDLFLYDIREDLKRRAQGFIEQRDERGRVV
ncbi:Pvc16 family protein [Agromyces soli]